MRKRLRSRLPLLLLMACMLFGLCAMPAFAADPPDQTATVADLAAKLATAEARITQLENKFAGAGGHISSATSGSTVGLWLTGKPAKSTSPQIAIYTERHSGGRAIVGAYGNGNKSNGLMACFIAEKEGSIQLVDGCGKVVHLSAGELRKLKALLTSVDKDEDKNESAALPKLSPGVATFDRRSDTLQEGLLE